MNKRRLAAIVMALYMGLTCLGIAGCNNLKYKNQENGIVEVTGTIDYDDFKHYKLVHITNKIAELDFYCLVEEHTYYNRYGSDQTIYTNIETDKEVYSDTNDDYKNFKIEIILDGLVDYLYKYDMVKEEYTIEDILYIKECLLSDDTLFKDVTASKPFTRRRRILIDDKQFII